MSFFSKRAAVLLFLVLLFFRIYSVFGVKPGNAPDELGHIMMVAGLSHGKLLTLEEGRKFCGYPYGLYNPMPYLPGAIMMGLAGLIDPMLSEMTESSLSFNHTAVRLARIGGLFWFLLFAVFTLKLIEEFPIRTRLILVAFVGLLPQLTFVQSYVNLDSMGPGVMAYLIWTLKEKRWNHCSFAVFLLLSAKLNYYCLIFLPSFLLLAWYYKDWKTLLKLTLRVLVLPLCLASLWFIYNYNVNIAKYGAYLGFDALPAIYHSPPGGRSVLHFSFLNLSLLSGFGLFGYMDQGLNRYLLSIWNYFICPLGGFFILKNFFSRKEDLSIRPWHFVFLIVFLSNWALHYLASYKGDYQAQGRYLFPAFLILLGYITYGISQFSKSYRQTYGQPSLPVVFGVVGFMLVSAIQGLHKSAQDFAHREFSPVVILKK